MNNDQLTPSESAMKELSQPRYLAKCSVTGRHTIEDTCVTYEVLVGDWIVWYREEAFGHDRAHRAGGYAFQELAKEQSEVMHEWGEKIRRARKRK